MYQRGLNDSTAKKTKKKNKIRWLGTQTDIP